MEMNNQDVQIPENQNDSISKLSDTESRISTLEQNMVNLNSSFHKASVEMKNRAKAQDEQQSKQDNTLAEILQLLKRNCISTSSCNSSDEANNLQMKDAGSPERAAGHC
jgi:transcriptional regulator of heat shock response